MLKSSAFFDLVTLSNLTSGMTILQATETLRFEALEFENNRILIECQRNSCNVGQLVKVDGFLCTPGQRTEFSAVGRIESAKPLATGVETEGSVTLGVVIQFLQYNKEMWELFIQRLEIRQQKVDDLFHSMRDEA